jgi:hypothetical protein
MMQMSMEAAAMDLKNYLFGPGYRTDAPGYIGIGTDRLFVYMKGSERAWLGKKPIEWLGWPVEWAWDTGEITPQQFLQETEPQP